MVSDLVRGNQLLRSGKLEEAVDAFQKAIALHPLFHWSHYKLGEALEKLGRLEEAKAAFQKALEINPNSPPIQFRLASVMKAAGRDRDKPGTLMDSNHHKPDPRKYMDIQSKNISDVSEGKNYYLSSGYKNYPKQGLVKPKNPFFFHTGFGSNQYITIDLGKEHILTSLVIVNRVDVCQERARCLFYTVHDSLQPDLSCGLPLNINESFWKGDDLECNTTLERALSRYITIFSPQNTALHFSAIKVFGICNTEQYIICKGIAGLGNKLYTLSHAIKYAKETNRKLIVEWNDRCYSSHPEKNVFYDCFRLINIDSSYRKSSEIPDYHKLSVAPPMWKQHLTKATCSVLDSQLFVVLDNKLLWKLKDEYNNQKATISTSQKYAEDIVVFTAFSPPLIEEMLLQHVRLQPNLEKTIDEFVANYFSSTVVGVHVRWTDKQPKHKMDILFKKINAILDKESNAKIYLATDNLKILNSFQDAYRNKVIFRHKWFPNSSKQPLHRTADNQRPVEDILFDAVIEMFLLSRCNYLIYQGNSTFSKISACYSIAPKINITSW